MDVSMLAWFDSQLVTDKWRLLEEGEIVFPSVMFQSAMGLASSPS